MSDEQPTPFDPFDPADMEAWQLIIDATGVNQLMAALSRIGMKAGVLAPNPMPVPQPPAEAQQEPDEVRETNGKGTPVRAAAAVQKEGK